MKTRELVSGALLLAIGYVLHAIVPPFFFGMKPDFLLTAMFIAILLYPNLRNTLTIGIAAGLITAMTTGFPGGQAANIVDKIITSMCLYTVMYHIFRWKISTAGTALVGAIGTLISGMVFLTVAALMVGLPQGFGALFVAVVLPAAGVNALFTMAFYKAATLAGKRMERTAA